MHLHSLEPIQLYILYCASSSIFALIPACVYTVRCCANEYPRWRCPSIACGCPLPMGTSPLSLPVIQSRVITYGQTCAFTFFFDHCSFHLIISSIEYPERGRAQFWVFCRRIRYTVPISPLLVSLLVWQDLSPYLCYLGSAGVHEVRPLVSNCQTYCFCIFALSSSGIAASFVSPGGRCHQLVATHRH